MATEDENLNASGQFSFRGIDYVIFMTVDKDGNSFTIEVQDSLTVDHWGGTFDVEYIEGLTHKTGNFKQFSIFANMLKTAILQKSDSVTLDLLTYSDLELLRQRRSGTNGMTPTVMAKPICPSNLKSRRYLILIYTVEFDRIHYPLPLHFKEKLNPKSLQETVVKLRMEIKQLKEEMKSNKLADFEKLQRQFDSLQKDKEIGTPSSELHQERRNGGHKKEVALLKEVIKKLENDLMKEKSIHQRHQRKKAQELRELQLEVKELRSSERQLKIRIKTLTNELAVYKRQQIRPARTCRRDRSSSLESMGRHSLRDRSSSRERSLSRERTGLHRERSNSRETRGKERIYSRYDNSLISSRHSNNSSGSKKNSFVRSRTPSPSTKNGRFDPTAYIRNKERKQEEIRNRKQWNRCNSLERKTKSSPKMRQLQRSIESYADSSDGNLSEGSVSSFYKVRHPPNQKLRTESKYTYTCSPDVDKNQYKSSASKNYSSTDNKQTHQYKGENNGMHMLEQSLEIAEIDAKLERLQKQLLKSSLS